jgi:hypothetical protein
VENEISINYSNAWSVFLSSPNFTVRSMLEHCVVSTLLSFPFIPSIQCVRVHREPHRPSQASTLRRWKWSSASPSSVTRWASFTFPFSTSISFSQLRSDLQLWFSLNCFVFPITAEQSVVYTELHGGWWCSQASSHRPLFTRCGRRKRCVYFAIVLI